MDHKIVDLFRNRLRSADRCSTQIEGIIHRIYDAMHKPARWLTILDAVAKMLKVSVVILLRYDFRASALRALYARGVKPDVLIRHAHNPWTEIGMHLPTMRVRTTDSFGPEPLEAIRGTPFELEVVEPFRMHHGCGAILIADEDCFAVFAVFRDNGAGPFRPDEQQVLEKLLEPLRAAMELERRRDADSRRIGAKWWRDRLAQRALNQLRANIFILDESGHVLVKNRAAKRVVERADQLRIDSGNRLAAVRPESNDTLQPLIAKAATQGIPGVLFLRAAAGPPVIVHVLPVDPAAYSPNGGASRCAAVVFRNGDDDLPSDRLLRDIYNFTSVEAKVARGIYQGGGRVPTASKLCLGQSTVHTHLQHIFKKTGTRKQAELVRLLTTTRCGACRTSRALSFACSYLAARPHCHARPAGRLTS